VTHQPEIVLSVVVFPAPLRHQRDDFAHLDAERDAFQHLD